VTENDKKDPQLDEARWLAWKEKGRRHDRASRKLQRLVFVVVCLSAAVSVAAYLR
jgi:hypothetical protein